MAAGSLGRRVPGDSAHIDKHRIRMAALEPEPFTVNRILRLPDLRRYWSLMDQGVEGSCVGYGSSWAMTILNKLAYASRWLYHQAQLIDEWHDTPPGEGTSVRAAMDVLRAQGHARWVYDRRRKLYTATEPDQAHGIEANKWATSVDETRACIKAGTPVVIGITWYSNFDSPKWDPAKKRWVIGRGSLGHIRGGHCVCLYGALDREGGFLGVNNWGEPMVSGDPTTDALQLLDGYPRFLLPYETMDRLLREDGECTLIVDRTGVPVQAP